VLKYHNATSDASFGAPELLDVRAVLKYRNVTSDAGVGNVGLLDVRAVLKYRNVTIDARAISANELLDVLALLK